MVRVVGHGLKDNLLNLRRQIRSFGERAGDGPFGGRFSGQHFIQQNAQGINIRAPVNGTTLKLLRTHIDVRGCPGAVSEAEISQQWLALLIQEDGGWFEIAVNKSLPVNVIQPLSNIMYKPLRSTGFVEPGQAVP